MISISLLAGLVCLYLGKKALGCITWQALHSSQFISKAASNQMN